MSELDLCLVAVITLLAGAHVLVLCLSSLSSKSETFRKAGLIIKSLWFIALPAIGAFYLGKYALLALFFCASLYINWEFTKFRRHLKTRSLVLVCLTVFLLIQYAGIGFGYPKVFELAAPLVLLVILPINFLSIEDIEMVSPLTALMVSSVLMNFYLSHFAAIPFIQASLWETEERALIVALFLIFSTELNDMFQFVCGKFFGKRKLMVHISPNKTDAGLLGAVLLTSLLYLAIAPHVLNITWLQAAILGVAVSLAGLIGDLLFSALRRYYKLKNFGSIGSGHGGVLDRLDSLIVTAPVFFYLVSFMKSDF